MAILDDMKVLLRITNSAYNAEITDLISAAEADLAKSGLYLVEDTDILIKRCIGLYVKSNFGWNNPDFGKLEDSYKSLKSDLAVNTDYSFYKVTINAGEQTAVIFDGREQETNDSGVVIFYTRAKNYIKYTVLGTDYYVDIIENTVITI